ncbi:MAG: 6-carboxytetrahydropterin synthase [Pseudomonadota bacterium]
MRIRKSVTFDAAHYLPDALPGGPKDHRYKRIHGHSFTLTITIDGEPDGETGWVQDFEEVTAALGTVRAQLDHHFLNEIEGLAVPTLENICQWVADALAPRLPGLTEVEIARPSNGESCLLVI